MSPRRDVAGAELSGATRDGEAAVTNHERKRSKTESETGRGLLSERKTEHRQRFPASSLGRGVAKVRTAGYEHILMDLKAEGWGKVLEAMGIRPGDIQDELTKVVEKRPPANVDSATPAAKRVIQNAQREAIALGHGWVGTEHILLALLREQGGLAAEVLKNAGVQLEQARQQVIDMIGGVQQQGTGQTGSPFPPIPGFPGFWSRRLLRKGGRPADPLWRPTAVTLPSSPQREGSIRSLGGKRKLSA